MKNEILKFFAITKKYEIERKETQYDKKKFGKNSMVILKSFIVESFS